MEFYKMLEVLFQIIGGGTFVFLFCAIVGYWLHQKAQLHPPLRRFGEILFRTLLTGQLTLIVPLLLYEEEYTGRRLFASFDDFLGIVGGWTLFLMVGCVWYWRHEERARRHWETQIKEEKSVEFECYYCGARISSPRNSIDQEIVCRGCENPVIVPPPNIETRKETKHAYKHC